MKMNIGSLDTAGTTLNVTAARAVPEQVGTLTSSQFAKTTGGNDEPSPAQLKQMVADMQDQLDSMNISLQYSLYGKNDRNIAVKVVNKETGDVIREIPPKEMQALQDKMSDLVGMIFNDKG
jgi:uncharacterized FlaG/YvyC family protein